MSLFTMPSFNQFFKWYSAGWEAFVTVSTEDYKKASALCLDREMDVAFTGFSPLVTTEVDEALQHGARR
jgi:hypothetical protein